MRTLFYCGWILLALALVAAATEPFLVQVGRGGLITPAYDLWYALAPGNLVVTEIRIERISPTLWHPVIFNILQAPAWFVLGLPGCFLTWYCRSNRVMSPEVKEEYERQKESLFVIDELSREAQLDEDYDPKEDDRAPVHSMFDLEQEVDEDIRNSLEPSDPPAGYPDENYADDYLRDLARDQLAAQATDPDKIGQIRVIDGLAFTETEDIDEKSS